LVLLAGRRRWWRIIWQFSSDNLLWNISFTRSVHDWEMDLVISFFDLLYSLRLRQGGGDEIYWIPSERRIFEVKSFYHALCTPVGSPFRHNSIWRNKAPSRGVPCMDGAAREDFNYGHLEEAARHSGGLVLHVQEWGGHRSYSSPLWWI
jgi:hypothetical protein